MKFNEKLILIMDCINATNIELAKVCNFDPTVISRYRQGKRIPTQGSNNLNNLVNGLCWLTLEKKVKNRLYKVCKIKKEKNLFLSVMNWLCEDETSIRLSKNENNLIGKNLTNLIKTSGVTNVELAKYLNKDYSLISKYRNNVTTLLKTDPTAEKMCTFFIQFAIKNNSLYLLTSLLGINENSDKNIIKKHLLEYLFSNKVKPSPVNSFLESLSEFTLNNNISIPKLNLLVPDELLLDKSQTYFGINGFRNAVKRFLGNIANSDIPTTLFLYSDESIKWMTGDKTFFNTWKALMFMILIKKNKIKIIHNINRNLIEMFDAIEGWLPLYMTGLIEPYYCQKTLNKRFNHTLFLAQNISSISSFSVKENNATIYNYSENDQILKCHEEQYSALIESCVPLVKIFVNNNIISRLEIVNEYKTYKDEQWQNIKILLKKDASILIYKTDTPSIMFEFEHPTMLNAFENYLNIDEK